MLPNFQSNSSSHDPAAQFRNKQHHQLAQPSTDLAGQPLPQAQMAQHQAAADPRRVLRVISAPSVNEQGADRQEPSSPADEDSGIKRQRSEVGVDDSDERTAKRYRCMPASEPTLIVQESGNAPRDTALIAASRQGNAALMKAALENTNAVDIPNDYGETAAMIAAERGNAEIFFSLFDSGKSVITTATKVGRTLLMGAIAGDNEFIVQKILARDADVDARTLDGFTALMFAASRKNTEIFRRVLEAGADVNIVNAYGNTALIAAIEARNLGFVQMLTARQCRLKPVNAGEQNPVFRAIECRQAAIVGALIDAGVNVEERLSFDHVNSKVSENISQTLNSVHMPLLMMAVFASDEATAKQLLDKGANVNALDSQGMTALMHAVAQQKFGLVKLLVEHGADVNIAAPAGLGLPGVPRLSLGEDSLAQAKEGPRGDVYQYQRENRDKGFTVADIALRDQHPEILDYLLRHGAKPMQTLAGPIIQGEISGAQ